MSALINELTAANFDALTAQGICFVEFYGKSCGPCKQMAAVMEDFMDGASLRCKAFKIDAEANMDIALTYRVRNLPTTLVMVDGKVTDQITGLAGKHALEDALKIAEEQA